MRFIFRIVQKEIIVLLGGPGTGKSTLINELVARGFCCYPEISRQVTMKAQEEGIEQLFLEQPLLFSQMLLEGRIEQYKNALNEPDNVVFIDRGIPDVVAYMDYDWGFESYEPVVTAQQYVDMKDQSYTVDGKYSFGLNNRDLNGFIGLSYFERSQDFDSTGSSIYNGDNSCR